MSTIGKVKRLIPNTRSRIKSSTSLPDIREETDQQIRTVISIPSTSSMNSASSSPPPNQAAITANNMDLISSLKIPDVIRFLPPYDGNPKKLSDFINNVEEILLLIRGTDKTPYGQMLLRAIRQKLEGKADDAVHTSGAGLNWDEIKDALILHCSDKPDEQTLMFELHNLTYCQYPIHVLFEKICEIKTALFKLTDTKECEPILIKTKKEFFANTCLNTFLTGIRGPLGLAVRSMRPTSLQEAFEWAMKERDIYFQENRVKQENRKKDYRGQGSRTDGQQKGYSSNQTNDYKPREYGKKRDYRQYAPNDKDNHQHKKNNVPAIMSKDHRNERSTEQRRQENPNSNRNRGSMHNIEQASTEYAQSAQLHNIDEDSNFPRSASRSKQDT